MRSFFPGILTICGLVSLSLISSVTADYFIDNANSTVAYAASGTSWQTFSLASRNLTFVTRNGNITVDSSKLYEQNYALAACTINNHCQVTIPFTGSGITVYVVLAGGQGVAATLRIDGGQPVTATLPPATPPSYQTPNVSLFDTQSLSNSPHIATINVLDWQNTSSSLYFDYARINETAPNLAVLPSSTPPFSSTATSIAVSSATSNTPQSQSQFTRSTSTFSTPLTTVSTFTGNGSTSSASVSNVNLRAIVGGACGGLVAFIVILTAIIFLKKRVSHHIKVEESRRPNPFPATPPVGHDLIASSPAHPPTNEKSRLRLPALTAAVSQFHTQLSANRSTDPPVPSGNGSTGRAQGADASRPTTDLFLFDDLIVDRRREGGSFRGSAVRNTPSIVSVVSAPPCYQTVEHGDLPSNFHG